MTSLNHQDSNYTITIIINGNECRSLLTYERQTTCTTPTHIHQIYIQDNHTIIVLRLTDARYNHATIEFFAHILEMCNNRMQSVY